MMLEKAWFLFALGYHIYVIDKSECIIIIGTIITMALEISFHAWLSLSIICL
jgi:hypothetical protein